MDELGKRSYFFDKGVRFSCTRCGHCCTGKPGIVRVTRGEVRAIAERLHVTQQEFIAQYTRPADDDHNLLEKPDGSCIFYDTDKGCTIHRVRPIQCRLFPFWFRNMRSEEAWQDTCRECPGIGQGDHVTKEEILMLLRQGIDHGVGVGDAADTLKA